MKILLNLSTLKKGGGQTVGLNFIEGLMSLNRDNSQFHFVVVKDSQIAKLLIFHNFNNITYVSQNPIKRILYEFLFGARLCKTNNISGIYTIFGFGLYQINIPQISGSADSNIYYPEINFWEGYAGIQLLKKKLIDRFRIYGLKKVEGVIFENESLEQRSKHLYNLKNTCFIKPSIIPFVGNLILNFKKRRYNGLFFCGWQKNKNYLVIPELAKKFKDYDIDFQFIFSVNNEDSEFKEFETLCLELDVLDRISFVGEILKNQIPSLYNQIDFVFLLSKLESFSNNIIEAWYFKKILIISDEEWSRSICKNAACYVDRNNIDLIFLKVLELINNSNLIDELIFNGLYELKNYPNVQEKVSLELDFVKKTIELYD